MILEGLPITPFIHLTIDLPFGAKPRRLIRVLSQPILTTIQNIHLCDMKRFLQLLAVMVTVSSSAQVVINEVCSSNADVNIDPEFGNFSGWVELYNGGNGTVNIGGYFLSDDPADPLKWQIPLGTIITSKSYQLIWCDQKFVGFHAGFTLDPNGENLILSNPSGIGVDNITYPKQFSNTSFSRLIDGGSAWRITATPTPKAANSQGPVSQTRLTVPIFSISSGRYAGSQSVSLSHPNTKAFIYFTLDGAEPTKNSSKYSAPINIPGSMVVKAKAFHDESLPSETVSKSYLINEHASSLPVVSVSTKPTYLWDNTIGIYADGTNGIPGNCNENPMNWNQDWSRHASFEYLDANGASKISQEIDFRIGGACSRNFPQKSFVVQPKKKYGANEIQYPFFQTKKNVTSFGELFLRNSGNDNNLTLFRDAFIQSLGIGRMDLDYMAYQPAIVYLNGQYWGIQDIREKIDGDFIQSNYGIDKADVDLLETYENPIEGTSAAWLSYKDSLQLLNPTDANTFNFINKHIDVQEYINYLITEIYVSNLDWPGNNVKFWRQRSTNGKFRWILCDTDFGFNLYPGFTDIYHPTLTFATDPNQTGWPNPAFSTLHIRLVLQNPEFRNRFIASFASAMTSTFNPDRVNQKITEFKSRIENEVLYHKARWGGTKTDWDNEVQRLRDFANLRHPFMQSHLSSFFGLAATVKFTASTSPPASGNILMNGVTSNGMTDAVYYKSLPYRVTAQAHAGFIFTGWTITTKENEAFNLVDQGSLWKYFDQVTQPVADWNLSTFNDATWLEGNAQLGYGDGDEATTVGFGPDANNKFLTTYFRKSFSIADTSGLTNINAAALFDDGVVVYLNGTEVFRNNMPEGIIANGTTALTSIAVENTFYPFAIDHKLLKPGLNTLAVEVHQSSGISSDISFDFSASCNRIGKSETYTVNNLEVQDTAFADVEMIAHFEPLPSIEGLVLNEFSTTKSAVDNYGEAEDWIELFNAGTKPIDIAGVLITDDLTVKNKHKLSNPGSPWLLEAGNYQLLWADGQVLQGKDHLPFKLSSSGDDIGLYHVAGYDTLEIAVLTFSAQPNKASLARIPNAIGPFEITASLTPGAMNEFVTGIEDQEKTKGLFYPNPADQILHIDVGEESGSVAIFDMMGKPVTEITFSTNIDKSISVSNLSNGAYIIKISSPKVNIASRLLVVHAK